MTAFARRMLIAALWTGIAVSGAEADVLELIVGDQSEISSGARKGDRVHVLLPLQAGTGFSWRVAAGSDDIPVRRSEGNSRKKKSQRLGTSVSQSYEFDCEKIGMQNLVFELVGPPGSPDGDRAVRRVKLRLSVE